MLAAYHRMAVELRKASSVVIGSHVKPDGDAIGSMLALTLALRELGIPAIPVLADDSPPPSTYEFLAGFGLFTQPGELEPPAVFVALDTPSLERLGAAASLASSADQLLVCDHHPDNQEFGTVNVVDPGAAASGQMIWHLIEVLGVTPTADIALCCWVALVTDTGRFSFSNTSAQALRDAASMVAVGVDVAAANRLVYESRSHASIVLEALVVSRLTLANGGRVAYAWVADADYEQTGAVPEETEHLIDALRVLGGIEVAALMRLHPESVRVNLRAKSGFDVGSIARRFGGGGHKPAAGFTYDGDAESLLAALLPVLPGGDRA